MREVIVKYVREKPKLKSPILIEGLPGVGNVGKLAADYIVDETKAKLLAIIYSKHLPPQVFVNDDGTIKQVDNRLYYLEKPELLILCGDYQGLTPEGQYELADTVIKLAKQFNVKRAITLGGYGVGRMVTKPRVIGATTSRELVKEMKNYGVVFPKGEPGSGIIGASGLLLGLGALRNIEGVCLMGETAGYFADPRAARAVLETLTNILGIKLDLSELERKARQIERITTRMKEIEEAEVSKRREELGYIG
ncbi:MAG: proteasome assembly chaperone family protein [Candidatus Thermoplasmatota archaeon]|nr:proteasome assembly chaperone family protein [Candidatus Thermoplasmatota archaeon]